MKKFSELEYVRPDIPRIGEQLADRISALEQATSYAQARAAFMECEAISSKLETVASLASVRNTWT